MELTGNSCAACWHADKQRWPAVVVRASGLDKDRV